MQQEGVAQRMAADNLILDRYELLGTAGAGGFGTVRIAWDPRIQRKVAIKTIKLTELDAYRAHLPGAQATADEPASPTADRWHGVLPWEEYLADDEGPDAPGASGADLDREDSGTPETVTSLAHLPGLDEARTAAKLDDPRIVTVYDFEVRERTAYLIMEYVEGITLTKLLAGYPNDISLAMVTAVFDAVAGALMTAHRSGVLHLDIKPDNIIITPQGQAKVTDFGLATLADASGVGTTGGGTIGYMPLEQMRREHLDARTDEWSLAALTYEMLTGDNPFRARNLDEAERAIEEAELVLPSLCWDDLDEQIDDVVFYALDPDREERYETVQDFAEEMDKFLGDAEQGREHLAFVVSDALGLLPEEPEVDEAYEGWDEVPQPHLGSKLAGIITGLLPNLAASSDRRDELRIADDFVEEDDGEYDGEDGGDGRTPRRRRTRSDRIPLRNRYGDRTLSVLAHVFGAVASAGVALLAVTNMPFLVQFGAVRYVIAAVCAVACAAGGLFRPHIGALSSFCLLGISFAACGHPIAAAVFVIATVAWWYTVGHEGDAPANVALMSPLAGAVGGSSAVPLVAGAALSPLPAVVTTAYSALVTVMLASFGSCSLLGWDAFAHWTFAADDMQRNLVALVIQPGTWAVLAGWLASSVVLSLLKSSGKRALTVVGVIASAACVVVGSIALGAPTPQLVISVLAAVVALLAVLV